MNTTTPPRPEPGTGVLVMTLLDGALYYTGELVYEDRDVVVLRRATWWRLTPRHSDLMAGVVESDETEREAYPSHQYVVLEREHIRLVVFPWEGDLDAGTR